MGWSIGYDSNWERDIGYGVPAFCDHPGCGVEIDRGLGYVCGGEPYGGEEGCGLFFCGKHQHAAAQLCDRCYNNGEDTPAASFAPSPDHPRWIRHKLKHRSWAKWRSENPVEVVRLTAALPPKGIRKPADTESDNG